MTVGELGRPYQVGDYRTVGAGLCAAGVGDRKDRPYQP